MPKGAWLPRAGDEESWSALWFEDFVVHARKTHGDKVKARLLCAALRTAQRSARRRGGRFLSVPSRARWGTLTQVGGNEVREALRLQDLDTCGGIGGGFLGLSEKDRRRELPSAGDFCSGMALANRGFRAPVAARERKVFMLRYSLIFLVVAIVAALLGFGGIAGMAASIAKVLFFVFLVLAAVTFLINLTSGRGGRTTLL